MFSWQPYFLFQTWGGGRGRLGARRDQCAAQNGRPSVVPAGTSWHAARRQRPHNRRGTKPGSPGRALRQPADTSLPVAQPALVLAGLVPRAAQDAQATSAVISSSPHQKVALTQAVLAFLQVLPCEGGDGSGGLRQGGRRAACSSSCGWRVPARPPVSPSWLREYHRHTSIMRRPGER